jgi:hypothetical protein
MGAQSPRITGPSWETVDSRVLPSIQASDLAELLDHGAEVIVWAS